MKDGEGTIRKHGSSKTQSQIVPELALSDPIEQGQWTNLPPKVLQDIIRRVEESEVSWPDRAVVVSCASVCNSWRKTTKDVVKTPQECGPISLKQPGPRESPIRCFIKRDKASSVYRLYLGLIPSEDPRDKLLLAAKRIRRVTGTDFVISLVADDFSEASLNFLGNKFSINESQPPSDEAIQHGRLSQRFQENALRHALYPFVFNPAPNEKSFSAPLSKAEESDMDTSSSGFSKSAVKVTSQESLMLKNKTPWCYWQQLILPTIYQSGNKRKSFYSLAELEETPSSWITATLCLPSKLL
ncbi:Tubby-like F-box protein 2 [Capsicum annuum]|uniref:Tubby-like F-box protein 2 n=1 Tax=Capsicum annuum TaxID=4072 RepID=A0A2G3AAL7_CAPAN|nr:Tubby-like F-box protein 2 [Capsicum annuum]PHT91223.1 Tubby-like F-box protein 2 [Capsicum annuum]